MDNNQKTDWSRRQFIQNISLSAAGLMLSFHIPKSFGDTVEKADESFLANAWLEVTSSNQFIFYLDKAEMGQGVYTTMPMILAEEAEIDVAQIIVKPAPLTRRGTGFFTGGSNSVITSYQPLRQAGAQTRELFKAAAAKKWGISVDRCIAENGQVKDKNSDRVLNYGDVIAEASTLPVPTNVSLKAVQNFKVIGTSPNRLDAKAKISGSAKYGIDVHLPEAYNAVIMRFPTFGGKIKSINTNGAEAKPGFFKVFPMSTGVAVVAKKFYQVLDILPLIKVEWEAPGRDLINNTKIMDDLTKKLDQNHPVQNDPNTGYITATYQTPFLAHATMEVPNCTVKITETGCEIWAPTQIPDTVRSSAARQLGIAANQVKVYQTFMGGGFGRRLSSLENLEAVELASITKQPIKLVYTREHDIQHDIYRAPGAHRVTAKLENGNITDWKHSVSSSSAINNDLAGHTGDKDNELPPVVFRSLGSAARNMSRTEIVEEFEKAGALNPYLIDSQVSKFLNTDHGIPLGYWRSVAHSFNGFVNESFIDELAHASKADPYAFRSKLLAGQTDYLSVLNEVARISHWGNAPAGRHQGIAIHKSFGSVVAQVVEISVSPFKIHKVYCAIDCGLAINPDNVKAQMESSIIFALSAALWGDIKIDKGAVKNTGFENYQLLRMNQSPEIEVVVMPSTASPKGVGEPGVPPLAPALGNALYRATGVRQRKLPFTT